MNISSQLDDKDFKGQALGISAVIYVIFLALLFFFKIMYEPIAEPLAMGVDLNYGVDLVGSGDIQTLNKANASKNNYDVKPAEKEEEKKEAPKPQPVKNVTPPAPEKKVTPTKQPPVISSETDESKVTVKKTTDAPVKNTAPVSNPTTTTTTKPTPPQPQRTVDQGSLFKKGGSNSSASNGTVGTRDGIGGNNNGDGKKGEVGDKGDPRGTLDGKSLYGTPGKGGTGGASVSISGWNKKSFSLPKDKSDETGRIVFKVTVDDTGDVVSIIVMETGLSPSVTNFYKNYISQKLSSYLVPEGTPPPRASGTITINITRGN
jgi:protein TonB